MKIISNITNGSKLPWDINFIRQDKKKHEFAIVEEFDHEEKHYVLVSEVKGDEITEGVYLFCAASQGEDFIVEEIEDKEEYAKAVKAYEALYQ